MTLYEITVENMNPNPQNFYFFQQPAEYSTGGSKVYTNSIGDGRLSGSGKVVDLDQLKFTLMQQYYAGAQVQLKPPAVGEAQVGKLSQVEIELASEEGKTNNSTELVIEGKVVHLNKAAYVEGVRAGAFRIITPEFVTTQQKYNIGLSTLNGDGDILISNFIEAEPDKNTDVQPIVKFYVATGEYLQGQVVDFTTSSRKAALCDATDGTLKFKVTYNANGSWTVQKHT